MEYEEVSPVADHTLTPDRLQEHQRRLQHLRRLTNDALDAAEAAGIEDAVNWGDLSCVDAALVLTDEGRSTAGLMWRC